MSNTSVYCNSCGKYRDAESIICNDCTAILEKNKNQSTTKTEINSRHSFIKCSECKHLIEILGYSNICAIHSGLYSIQFPAKENSMVVGLIPIAVVGKEFGCVEGERK